jgi:hypothetical protein
MSAPVIPIFKCVECGWEGTDIIFDSGESWGDWWINECCPACFERTKKYVRVHEVEEDKEE